MEKLTGIGPKTSLPSPSEAEETYRDFLALGSESPGSFTELRLLPQLDEPSKSPINKTLLDTVVRLVYKEATVSTP